MTDIAASAPTDVQDTTVEPNLTIARNLKIGLFHLGSGMADVLATGVWNRIMISDLGFAATPIGILVALRYFLAPLGIWAGRKSDERTYFGYRRLFWVWLGRAMMVLSVIALGFVTATLARGEPATTILWLAIAASLILFSLGNAISGSTFLALVYDRAAPSQRTRAVGIVWTFLLLGFTIGGIFFAVLLPASDGEGTEAVTANGLSYTPDQLLSLFLIAALVMGGLWFISLIGEEKRRSASLSQQDEREGATPSVWSDLKGAWQNRTTRYFFWYLGLSMAFAFSQDLILEPFAGDVFGMSAHVTTRFAAYWGSMAIIATILFIIASRRFKRLTNRRMNFIGVSILLLTFVLLALSSLAGIRGLVTPALITLGIGLGVWNVGTLGMMMDMSPFGKAGTFLGFWTLVVTLARGLGVSGGGILRDVFLGVSDGNYAIAYGIVFAIGAAGLGVSLYMLSRVKMNAVPTETTPASAETVFAGAMD
jgi:BCD family chlorophyll transporter-like MFS transporter